MSYLHYAEDVKAYWQHSGEILSSRKAQAVLRELGHPAPSITEGFPACPHDQSMQVLPKVRRSGHWVAYMLG